MRWRLGDRWPRAWLPEDRRRWFAATVAALAFLLLGIGLAQTWSRLFEQQERADAEEQRADAACDRLESYNLACPSLAPVAPQDGEDGRDGRDGRDATDAMVDAAVARYIATHEIVDVDELIREVAKDVAGSMLMEDTITDAVERVFAENDFTGPMGPSGPPGEGRGPTEEEVVEGVEAFYAARPCAWTGVEAEPAFVTVVTTGGPLDAWVCVPVSDG